MQLVGYTWINLRYSLQSVQVFFLSPVQESSVTVYRDKQGSPLVRLDIVWRF